MTAIVRSRMASLRWLALLVFLSTGAVTLAYQRVEPYRIDLAGHNDDALLEGFHATEGKGANTFRWTEARGDARFPNLFPAQPVQLVLRLAAPRPGGGAPVTVNVHVNDAPLAAVDVGPAFTEHTFDLDAAVTGASGNVHVTLLSPAYSAPNDGRELGVMVSRLEVVPQGHAPYWPSVPIALTLAAVSVLVATWQRRLAVPEWASRVVDLTLIGAAAVLLVAARPVATQPSARVLFTLLVAFAASEGVARLGRFAANVRAYRWAAAQFFAAFALRMLVATAPGDESNFIAFKAMLDQATRFGIAQIYKLDPVYGAYPPFHHYHLWIVGVIYRAFVAPDLYAGSLTLNYLIKMPTIVYDMLVTVLIVAYVSRRRDARTALWAGAAYALNPAIIYISAYNGQFGDPIYAFYVALAVVGLLTQNPFGLGIGAALALLTKPQAAAFAPFLALGMLRHLGKGRAAQKPIACTLLAGAVVSALVLAPFALAGTLPEMVRTVSTTIGHGPRISANAFNIWWPAGWGDAWNVNDTLPLIGPVSYRAASLFLFFGVAYGWIAWRTWRARGASGLALIAGFTGLAFFMLPTEIHENYLFPTIPLLALLAAHDRRAWPLIVVLGVSGFLNNVMIDPTLMPPLFAALPPAQSWFFPLSLVLSLANVAVLGLWAWWVRKA